MHRQVRSSNSLNVTKHANPSPVMPARVTLLIPLSNFIYRVRITRTARSELALRAARAEDHDLRFSAPSAEVGTPPLVCDRRDLATLGASHKARLTHVSRKGEMPYHSRSG